MYFNYLKLSLLQCLTVVHYVTRYPCHLESPAQCKLEGGECIVVYCVVAEKERRGRSDYLLHHDDQWEHRDV